MIEVYAHLLELETQPFDGIQGFGQERRVVAIGWGGDDPERDAIVDGHRAFDAPLSSIHQASACLLAAAGHLGEQQLTPYRPASGRIPHPASVMSVG